MDSNSHQEKYYPSQESGQRIAMPTFAQSSISQPFVLKGKLFSGLPHKDQLITHLFIHPPYKQLKP